MHSVLKAVLKSVPTSLRSSSLIRPGVGNGAAARSLWNLSNRSSSYNKNLQISSPSLMCSCGCGSMRAHTKGRLCLALISSRPSILFYRVPRLSFQVFIQNPDCRFLQ